MRSLRLASLALTAAALMLSAAGCRTAGMGNLTRTDPVPSRSLESASELLDDHNRNAELIQSLQADASVSSKNRNMVGGMDGKLALERPRNFNFILRGPLQDYANIGSNNDEFWFWAKGSPEKAVYYCNYDETGNSPLSAAGLQPEWIIEALGLRVISDGEAAKIKVAPGKEPGTLTLTHRQKTPQGEEIIKETILNESNGRIREHWVYSAEKHPLAHAVISEYQDYPLPAAAGAPAEMVYLPKRFRLEWMNEETMALDVTLSRVVPNAKFDAKRRQALFVEPKYKSYTRVNLERSGMASTKASSLPPATNTPTTVRESLPAPPPRVRLDNPAPLGINGASSRKKRFDPADQGADMPPAYARGIEEVVGPPIPTINDPLPQLVEAQTGWRGSVSSNLER